MRRQRTVVYVRDSPTPPSLGPDTKPSETQGAAAPIDGHHRMTGQERLRIMSCFFTIPDSTEIPPAARFPPAREEAGERNRKVQKRVRRNLTDSNIRSSSEKMPDCMADGRQSAGKEALFEGQSGVD